LKKIETLGDRIRRVRHERGMSLAKVCGGDFSRAFLNQVELGRSQPSTRVLRVIAGRLGTEVDYLLEGTQARLEREIALEKGRVLLARGGPRRALAALGPALESTDWPLEADALLCQAQALLALARDSEAGLVLAAARKLISAHRDRRRAERALSIEERRPLSPEKDPVEAHLKLADRAQRAADGQDALEHYRVARILLEAGATGLK
jgi:transcriptional regulator with XRE-family HTH domain